jgi:predicted PurR-regulated permease PerM
VTDAAGPPSNQVEASTTPTGNPAPALDPPSAARVVIATPSPFTVGFAAAVGVGIAYLLFRTVVRGQDIVILLGLSLFLAAGMDPLVRFGQRLGLARAASVAVVFLVVAGAFTGFGFAVVPPLVDQVTAFIHHLPGYLDDLQRNHRIADLDRRFHLIQKARDYVSSGGLLRREKNNVLQAGSTVATTVFDGVSVLILTLYFMAYFDEITEFAYRLVPRSRRTRAHEVGTKITAQIGEYVAGNLLMGLVAGLVSLLWLWATGAPYPIALAFVVALFDVVPLVGAAIAAVIVTTVVLITSIGWGIATLVFFIGYQIVENYLLEPRVFPNHVRINPVVTILGALVGATLLGVIGFLLVIPLVAAASLVLREVVVPRQADR